MLPMLALFPVYPFMVVVEPLYELPVLLCGVEPLEPYPRGDTLELWALE